MAVRAARTAASVVVGYYMLISSSTPAADVSCHACVPIGADSHRMLCGGPARRQDAMTDTVIWTKPYALFGT